MEDGRLMRRGGKEGDDREEPSTDEVQGALRDLRETSLTIRYAVAQTNRCPSGRPPKIKVKRNGLAYKGLRNKTKVILLGGIDGGKIAICGTPHSPPFV